MEDGKLSKYPFADLSWQFSKASGRFVSNFDEKFLLRQSIVYYLGPQLNANQAEMAYTQLEETNFASLYAATSPFDDFAESFVTYVHAVMMNKPFEVTIAHKNTVVKRFGSCWKTKRCEQKRRLIEAFIEAL